MNLTEQDVRELRKTPGDLIRLIKQARANALAENARRRALVLKHPDLAARLCEPPLRHTLPEHWTGYIPPAHDAETFGGAQPLNTSPARAALLELLNEAEHRTTNARKGNAACTAAAGSPTAAPTPSPAGTSAPSTSSASPSTATPTSRSGRWPTTRTSPRSSANSGPPTG